MIIASSDHGKPPLKGICLMVEEKSMYVGEVQTYEGCLCHDDSVDLSFFHQRQSFVNGAAYVNGAKIGPEGMESFFTAF
jgi:hypothetical protein